MEVIQPLEPVAQVIRLCYSLCMPKQSFVDIRTRYPKSYLLLLDYDETQLPSGEVEITAAQDAIAFDSGDEMLDEYKRLRQSGRKVMFCSPDYTEKLVVERRPSMRVLG